ncbi:MAG: adenine phosphoribosyltransferase [Nitrospiria bacterium]
MDLKSVVRGIPDYPKKGIYFYDVTTLLKEGEAFVQAIDQMVEPFENKGIQKIVAVESRGFILGAPVAYRLGAGFVPVRKPGKLPHETFEVKYDLEYGSDGLSIHQDAILKGEKILIVDDLLATGGTCGATVKLIEKLGGVIIGIVFLIELKALNGRSKLGKHNITSLLTY